MSLVTKAILRLLLLRKQRMLGGGGRSSGEGERGRSGQESLRQLGKTWWPHLSKEE